MEEDNQPRLDFYRASPEAILAMRGLEARIQQGGIEQSLQELVRLRASQINGCAYCVDLHSSDARKAGERERRLATVALWRETQFFSERERAALAWTEALTLVADTQQVPGAIWQAVKPHFSDAEIVELTLLVVAINGWNRFAIAFRKLPTE
jgi:AhpD family alkylhydroperoxidase